MSGTYDKVWIMQKNVMIHFIVLYVWIFHTSFIKFEMADYIAKAL